MDDSVDKKLHQLFLNYEKNLPDKIRHIEDLWAALSQNFNVDSFQVFHREVHSLYGSSGTYGFINLSQSLRMLEKYLKELADNQSLTDIEKENIGIFINQLKSIPLISSYNTQTFVKTETQPTHHKIIYILEPDKVLTENLSINLENLGYEVHHYSDIKSLKKSIEKIKPLAMIVNTVFLNKQDFDPILKMQKTMDVPIPLFAIIPDRNLEPRLQAIRAGCDAFFQKPVDIYYLTNMIAQKCSEAIDESYRILIIEDTVSLAEYYALILNQAGMIAESISDPMLLLQKMEQFNPDLLLMDIYMPDCTGLELAAVLRQEANYTKIPIIFLSTEDDKHKQMSAIGLGVDDFLTKPISPEHLISAVKSRSKRAGVLGYYMTTDSLTGLLNHSTILKQLDLEIEQAKKENLPLSFIMIDIDNFKQINDVHGHQAGDIVLKKLASLLLNRFKKNSIGRYGGEEFAIILPAMDCLQSEIIIESLREQFSTFVFTVNNNNFSVKFSAGIADLKTVITAKNIVNQADMALYQAKECGRNQIVVYNASISGRNS